jgi:hypothetical protein
MPQLYRAVLAGAADVADSPGLRLASAHKQGAVHMLVEQQKAGWVLRWKEIARSHSTVVPDSSTGDSAVSQTLDKSGSQAASVAEGALSNPLLDGADN